MSLRKFLSVLASKIEVEIYTSDSAQVLGDISLFRGPCEVARDNFPLDAYDIVLISFKGSDGICRILVQEVKRNVKK